MFDSLSILRSAHEYRDVLQRACEHFGKYCTDQVVQSELLDLIKSIGYETIEIPQQPNAHDCGWYVMKCMRMLIEGGLVGCPPRSWLSRKWFQHEDVEILKDLREWLAQALGEVPLQKE
ncbi:hypothetical protein GOP47_0021567 [Adiantum capillus-veneris]|uniref:Ubiquitin-like protease family profile domain-containing protein n=1 Tax=Adiantum capillus-veneris TaxID=13818 RepID=A0A9D4U801_ADICA|nr:hypothetical protein GOP47_0021567 [Adiantum capillus-veneris]